MARQARSKTIPWEGYQRASIITDHDLSLIQNFDRQSAEGKRNLIKESSSTYAPLLVGLLGTLVRDDTAQYLLATVDDILTSDPDSAQFFHALTSKDPSLPFAPFFKLLSKDDVYTSLAAAKIITFLLCSAPGPVTQDLSAFFTYLQTMLVHQNSDVCDLVVQFIQSLLSVISLRLPIFDFNGGKLISGLLDVLAKQASPQTQYQVIFCFWLLSFEREIAREVHAKFSIITQFTDIAKGATKEKVIRVVLALFKNLIQQASNENTVSMIGSKLLPFLDVVKQRKFEDHDIVEDAEFLQVHLREALQRLSSYDEYSSEVRSGKLEWSPAHNSEVFWKQNAARLNEHSGELAKLLGQMLVTSSDPLVLAVAAHDLGQFVKYYPAGKKLLQDIGAKTRLMEMMNHENADVRYQALVAVQKIMSQSWDI